IAFALPPLGRPGLGSNVSIWLGAPGSQIRITVVAFFDFGAVLVSCLGSAFVSWASRFAPLDAIAPMPSMLNDRKSRRPNAGTTHLLHAISIPSKLSKRHSQYRSMSRQEFSGIHQGPVRVLHPTALMTVDVLHEPRRLRLVRLP